MAAGNVQDGIYTIYIGPKRFKVYCVMSVDGGGWTSCGKSTLLSGSAGYHLRVDMKLYNGHACWTCYNNFSVGLNSLNPEKDGYLLRVTGFYSGNTGDVLVCNSGMRFSTYDHDTLVSNCAKMMSGGWSYGGCSDVNSNGVYSKERGCQTYDGIYLLGCNSACIIFMEMKIRPAPKKAK